MLSIVGNLPATWGDSKPQGDQTAPGWTFAQQCHCTLAIRKPKGG